MSHLERPAGRSRTKGPLNRMVRWERGYLGQASCRSPECIVVYVTTADVRAFAAAFSTHLTRLALSPLTL